MVQTDRYDANNIFAKMLRGEIPNVTVYEDENVLSFMDIFPQTSGHTLVIPKKAQATNFLDIEPEELAALINGTQKVASAVNDGLNPDGIRIIQYNGTAAGQTVFHIHFHIIPIWEGLEMKGHGSEPADTEELKTLADKIKAHL